MTDGKFKDAEDRINQLEQYQGEEGRALGDSHTGGENDTGIFDQSHLIGEALLVFDWLFRCCVIQHSLNIITSSASFVARRRDTGFIPRVIF